MFPAEELDSRGVTVGRYLLHRQIARGGMATIHIARLLGDEGFSRIVAAKRLLPDFAQDSEFVTMFLDEARVASKVHHRNIVPVLDVVTAGDEVILVQEYVHGVPLNILLRQARHTKTHVPVKIAVSIATQILAGLQAAHMAVDEVGMPLNIVHRDVSPHNVMISVDGTARVLDFGVAKATMAAHITKENTFKGKLAYSAPEQLSGAAVRQSDVYSAAVTLWEMIVGRRMHMNASEREIAAKIMTGNIPTLTQGLVDERDMIAKDRWAEIEALERVVMKGLAVEVHDRWPSASAMEAALTNAVPPASLTDVADWVRLNGKEMLDKNEKMLAAEEASWRRHNVISGRLTPLPPELRRTSQQHMTVDEDTMTTPDLQSHSSQSAASVKTERKKLGIAVAVGAFGALLIVLIVLLLSHRDRKPAEPQVAPLPAPAPQPPVLVAPTPTPLPPVVRPPAPVATPPPAVAPTPPEVTTPEPEPKPKAKPKPIVHVAKPPPPKHVATQPPPPAPVVEPAPKHCDPPYYYEGKKKVYKPECL